MVRVARQHAGVLNNIKSDTHLPAFEMMCAFARVLNMPEGYCYTVDDSFAEFILKLYEGEVVQWKRDQPFNTE
ncbi:hypothetical protein [Dickeya solani]|uniref:hypothetical protein n=1 Tax=Dickeya solani TaxID=1089444 RepID=UPI0009081334